MKATIAASILILLTGCTVTSNPDGSVTRTADYNAWLEIARLIANDEIPVAPIISTK